MKTKINYKQIYSDIKDNKLNIYCANYIKEKNELNVRTFILGTWCKQILAKYNLSKKECISILKNTNTLINIRIE